MAANSNPAEVHWSYTGSTGPENWANLSEEFCTCGEGTEQSPVDIRGYVVSQGDSIVFSYGGTAIRAHNNGHTVQLDFPAGETIDIGVQSYELQGLHYHSPSEHLVDGESFAAELHLVHRDAEGNLAVIGLLFRTGEPSLVIQGLLDAAPGLGASADLEHGLPAASLVPDALDYFGYNGSLTTPPCTEGVRWVVMQSIGTLSQEQVERLRELTGGPNNRPVQPIGGRQVLQVSS